MGREEQRRSGEPVQELRVTLLALDGNEVLSVP